MFCKDLKVTGLSITEDYYEYKALFKLSYGQKSMDFDLAQLSLDENMYGVIKREFQLEESVPDIKSILMEKILEGSALESRNIVGEETVMKAADGETERRLRSLNNI